MAEAAVSDDEPTNQRLVDTLVLLAREYADVTGTLCADLRVPKDLRDQLAAHTAGVLNELPARIRRAADPMYGLEDAKVDWAGRIVADDRMPPEVAALVSAGQDGVSIGRIEGIGGDD
jgi:hypothetical protein